MFSLAPGYGGETLTFFHRMALSFMIAAVMTPVVNLPPEFNKIVSERYVTVMLEQAAIGLFIGFSLQLIFTAYQMAGEFFSVQMGFGVSEVFDPMAQISLPLLGTLKNLMALFVFFVSGAHLHLIRAIAYSFEKIPYLPMNFMTEGGIHSVLLKFLALMGSAMFVVGLKIALPVMGTLLLVSVTIGMLSKAAPQMNLLMMGYPMKILIGFMVLLWVSPVIIETMFAQFDIFFNHLDTLIGAWK